MTAAQVRAMPDDAPATAFAPDPVAPYRRGFEDAAYDGCWFCPWPAGSREATQYEAGHRAGKQAKRERTAQ